jgi:guanylate kinase
VEKRLRKAEDEEKLGGELADLVIVNDDLARATRELRDFVGAARASRR